MKKLLILLSLCYTCVLFAQKQSNDDIKIGLVLSGGGAKGFAHIGVLKVIDSLGIKIDYISGTSMGAVVGALYASGYSGKQLDSIFSRLTFNEVVNDEVPRASKTFYERDNSERHAITLPFDKFKIQLPSGISKGQNIFDLFTKLTFHVNEINDYEKLPIPFFCIATNVETGVQVILDKGILAESISASSAFPSLYQPIIIDDMVLIDGGVANNYPIEELKAKGMDVIIGIDVQDDLANRNDLKTGPDILLQINNYRTTSAMKKKSKLTDIYIRPDITDFTVVSFGDGKEIIEKGRLAANKSIEQLKNLQKTNHNYIPPTYIKHPDSIKINNITIAGNKNYTRSYILGKLKIKSGEKISYNDFEKGVSNIVATDNFESFLYDFKPDGNGFKLNIKLRESKFTTFLKLGAHFDDLYKSGALVNVTKNRLLFNNDVATLDLVFGDNLRYDFEYYIDKGFYWSIGLKSRYNEFDKGVNIDLFSDNILAPGINQLNIDLSDQTNQIYLQTLFRKDFSLKLGAEHKRLKITSETFLNNPDPNITETTFENSDFVSVFGNLKFDTLDDKFFPKEGFLFDGDFHLYLASSDFNNNFSQFSIAKANIAYVKSFGSKLAVTVGSEGGFRVGEDSNRSLSFILGGYGNNFINNFTSFYGYDFLSLNGNSFVKGLINIDYEIFNKHHVNVAANYANVEDDLFSTGEWFSVPDFSGYALGYGIETLIGPVEFKFTWSPETKRSELFFAVGYWF
ncbi:patatin [Flavobacteriaceae bacterium AU392]|nr:patatin [Flavobacteriaceae bacterium]RKM84642.1 patatin [Flavobacteriaceae bacterium AU392]